MLRWWTNFTVDHLQPAQLLRELCAFLPTLNYITIHYAYFIVVILVTSAIFWGSSEPAYSISYVDSLFLTVSAMTEAGLNTVNLSQMTTWQQVLLWLLILLGGTVWVSIWTVVFRLHAFEKHFEKIVEAEREKRAVALRRRGSSSGLGAPASRTPTMERPAAAPSAPPAASAGEATKPDRRDGAAERTGITPLEQQQQQQQQQQHQQPPPPPPPSGQGVVSATDVTSSTSDEQAGVIEDTRHASTPPRSRIAFADGPSALLRNSNNNNNKNAGTTTGSIYGANDTTQVRRRLVDAGGSHARRGSSGSGGVADAMRVHDILTNKTVGRNAQFHDLTSEEREHLGGCEYRALRILAVVVPLYFTCWQVLGCVALGAWIAYNKPEVATSNGLGPWWTGVFFGVSAFNNSGMALLDANVVPFQSSFFVLIVMGAMILAGNTAYPILLRFIFWSMLKVVSWGTDDDTLTEFKDTLRFILKYPRRIYTNMFPSRQTWWLLFMVCLLNCIDWVGFELLNLGNPTIEAIPVGSRIIDGLFQGIAVRSGGFYLVPISSVYIGLQILYVIMMYISVYPVVITMRHSNVYEERSLGIYADDPEPEMDPEQGGGGLLPGMQRQDSNFSAAGANAGLMGAAQVSRALRRHFTLQGVGALPGAAAATVTAAPDISNNSNNNNSRISFISQQIQGQIAHDIWFLVLAVLVISVIETSHFLADPVTYSVFNVIFEVVSAYGTVGISVGLPTAAYSFSGGWYTGSKLVLCLVMLRGRHRGLPVALDRAVRLPGEHLSRDEEEDYRIRRSMTSRRRSVDSRIQ